MNSSPNPLPCLLALFVSAILVSFSWADTPEEGSNDSAEQQKQSETEYSTADANGSNGAAKTSTSTGDKPKPEFGVLLKGARIIDGLITTYRKDSKLYGAIRPDQLDKDFIVIISIARGMGERPLLGGMSWGFGDEWIWQFRKRDDRIQIVRRNVRFRAAAGTPQEEAVRFAYTDSVLFSLPIATTAPNGGHVVDLTPVFMSDLPQISSVLKGFSFSKDKSSWVKTKGFRDNVEIEVSATYASSGTQRIDTVADSRGVTINVHYSISKLPTTGYEPRLADDRIGYFLTVVKDYSRTGGRDRFVRYINRWDLQKADPKAEVSPPKTPIIFWIEHTVPYKYRKPIREGILEWNKAFEKAGIVNAIEVRQQPRDADWDPEDINYNTFRWITSSAGFAMGPSRVNPITGQILDTDIIFDADFLQTWRLRNDVYGPQEPSTGMEAFAKSCGLRCEATRGLAHQLALGRAFLASGRQPLGEEQFEELVMQGIKAVATHEVGHTLGLRHNFKASTYLTLDEINDPNITKKTGLAASIMDYIAMNLSPDGEKQGEFFSSTIGPYDYWAIEYGYRPLPGKTEAEVEELKKIASRSALSGMDYGTDEDAGNFGVDPLCNRFDLGKNPIAFARQRAQLIEEAIPGLVERMTKEGEDYNGARIAFNVLLAERGRAMMFAAKFIGGVYVNRDHRGTPDARPPLVIVERRRQREAMMLLEEEVFGQKAYEFPSELYNYLAPSFWSHWGNRRSTSVEYPIHEVIASWQDQVLARLLSSTTLTRLVDSQLQVDEKQDAFTTAELFQRLGIAIFSELDAIGAGKFTEQKPAISSLRRSLQRRYVQRLSRIALGTTGAPEDCQSIAYVELESLEKSINQVLSGKAQLDANSRAHLTETSARIRKAIDARMQLLGP